MTDIQKETESRYLRLTVAVAVLGFVMAVGASGAAVAQTEVSSCGDIDSPGEYEISQDIDTSSTSPCINIKSSDVIIDGNETTLNGTSAPNSVGVLTSTYFDPLSPVPLTPGNVTVKNLTVRNFDIGVGIFDTELSQFTDIEVSSTNTSVDIRGSGNLTLDEFVVSDTHTGVVTNDTTNITVENSHIQSDPLADPSDTIDNDGGLGGGNLFGTQSNGGSDGPGVVFIDTKENSLVNSVVTGFNDTGVKVNVTKEGPVVVIDDSTKSSANEIVDSVVTNNQVGVLVENSTGNKIHNNTVGGNTEDGIRVSTGQGGGITLSSSSDVPNNEITHNDVKENGLKGIMLTIEGNLQSTITNTTVANNNLTGNRDGIFLTGSVESEIRNNSVANSSGDGISIGFESNRNNITRNNVTNTTKNGIIVSQSSENNLTSNVVTNSSRSGIQITRVSDENKVKDNSVTNNSQHGIWINRESTKNRVIDNSLIDNDESGVYLGGVATSSIGANETVIVNNTVSGSEYGVWLSQSFRTESSENTVTGNEEGIALNASSDNRFDNDTAKDNVWDFESVNGSVNNSVSNLDIGDSTAPETTLSFDSKDVKLGSVDSPPADPGSLENIGRYFEAEEESSDSFLDFELHYKDGDTSGVNESTLELRRYDGSSWVTVPGYSVDEGNNVISANVSSFSDFGVFGESQGPSLDDYRDDPNDPTSGVSLSGLQSAIQDFVNKSISLSLLQDVIQEFIAT